jgi:FkbM family methyltransferase
MSFTEWNTLIGMRSTAHWYLIRLGQKLGIETEKWRVRPRQVGHALAVRLQGSSDMSAFRQIFCRDEYSNLRSLDNVSLVMDLGANVGFSSAYFLNCFQNCRVIAVEPDERNVALCQINLRPYGDRVLLLHGAAWKECKRLRLSKGKFGDKREWATQVLEVSDGAERGDVQAWDVNQLIDMADSKTVDLLKIDVERSELALFGDSARTWLPRVRNICIELHGPDCEEVFFRALRNFDYELELSGELTICRNIRAKIAEECERAEAAAS